jgi:hypothetical protein
MEVAGSAETILLNYTAPHNKTVAFMMKEIPYC